MKFTHKIFKAIFPHLYAFLKEQYVRSPKCVGQSLLKLKQEYLIDAEKAFTASCIQGNLEDYKDALDKYFVSLNEYKIYKFWQLSESERSAFVSWGGAFAIYQLYHRNDVTKIMCDKVLFLECFHCYVHRKWIVAKNTDFNTFMQFVTKVDCIAKPMNTYSGTGIFKIYHTNILDVKTLYEQCQQDNLLIEECIQECDELLSLHPNSVNTIRVVTIAAKNKVKILGAVFRIGKGNNVVDNVHNGGLCTSIDLNTGIVNSNAVSMDGTEFITHPDTDIPFKGLKIPKWGEIKKDCCKAALLIPHSFIIGWDVIVNLKGDVEFIEGNVWPSVDIMQAPTKYGLKQRIQNILDELFEGKINYNQILTLGRTMD